MQRLIPYKNAGFTALMLALLGVGLFNEYMCGLFAALISCYLIYIIIKSGEFTLKLNWVTGFIGLFVVMYILSCFWAVDRGYSVFGIVKFLPVPLFLSLCYCKKTDTEELLSGLPLTVAAITVVTAVLMQFYPFSKYFAVAGRLAGILQYPNTYALLCLISLIVLLNRESIKLREILIALVLVFGILYSGSRTVFALTLLSLAVMLFRIRSKKIKLAIVGFSFVAAVLAVLYAVLTNSADTVLRLTRFSLSDSSVLGRFLYVKDALPTIAKRPFGLGYMGYYFLQGSFKTGVYSVMYIHNDFVQVLLDIGWVPFAVFAIAIIKSLFSKNISFTRKFALVIFSLHSLLDFNLQFSAMLMLFVLLLDFNSGREIKVTKCEGISFALGLSVLGSAYLGVGSFLHFIGKYEAALSVCPFNTFSKIEVLTETENTERLNAVAQSIIEQNPYVSLAYSAKAKYYYSQGDFGKVIEYKKKALEYNYYDSSEYTDYCQMLMTGMELYAQAGDTQSYEYCARELIKVPDMMEKAESSLSTAGRNVRDKATLRLSSSILKFIEELQQ